MPNLTIKKMNVTINPGQKPVKMDAVIEVESGDPLGFYRCDDEGCWKFYIIDTVYDYREAA